MAHKTTVSLDILTCTDYVEFGNCPDRFGRFFWSKKDSNYLDLKLKLFKKDDNKEFRLVQNLTMAAVGFSQFMRLRNQLVNPAEVFARKENLAPVLMPTKFKIMDGQLKLAHKVVDVVQRPKERFLWLCCGTLWTNLRVPVLKSDDLQGRRRTRSFNKLSMWIIKLENLSFYLV